MASTLVALQTVTVGAGGVSSITFSSIPQTYNDLVIKTSTSTNVASQSAGIQITFNGSSSGYSERVIYGIGSSAASASASSASYINFYYANGNTATSNTFANGEFYIPNYTSSNFKSISLDSTTENNATVAVAALDAGLWSNTAAINAITLSIGGLFFQYSTFTLYGVYNSPLETTPEAPTIGTATAASTGAYVAFTPSGTGAPATSYVATSSPGGITATGYTSPILVTGLTSGTAYTFTVKGQNPGGTGAASAASNSVTPYDGYESIATVYAASGGSSTLTFSSIPSIYTHLQVRFLARSTFAAANTSILLRMNSDTASNYSYHSLSGDGASATSYGVATDTKALVQMLPGSTVTSNVFGGGIIDILDYANTNKYKTTRSLAGGDRNGSGNIALMSSSWRSTSAIDTITLTTDGNFAQYSVFELFGIRG